MLVDVDDVALHPLVRLLDFCVLVVRRGSALHLDHVVGGGVAGAAECGVKWRLLNCRRRCWLLDAFLNRRIVDFVLDVHIHFSHPYFLAHPSDDSPESDAEHHVFEECINSGSSLIRFDFPEHLKLLLLQALHFLLSLQLKLLLPL